MREKEQKLDVWHMCVTLAPPTRTTPHCMKSIDLIGCTVVMSRGTYLPCPEALIIHLRQTISDSLTINSRRSEL